LVRGGGWRWRETALYVKKNGDLTGGTGVKKRHPKMPFLAHLKIT